MNESSDRPAHDETARVEAFSDGVFAIAITLLILEIRVSESAGHDGLRSALVRLWPSYLAFLASFMTIGVMWPLGVIPRSVASLPRSIEGRDLQFSAQTADSSLRSE